MTIALLRSCIPTLCMTRLEIKKGKVQRLHLNLMILIEANGWLVSKWRASKFRWFYRDQRRRWLIVKGQYLIRYIFLPVVNDKNRFVCIQGADNRQYLLIDFFFHNKHCVTIIFTSTTSTGIVKLVRSAVFGWFLWWFNGVFIAPPSCRCNLFKRCPAEFLLPNFLPDHYPDISVQTTCPPLSYRVIQTFVWTI